MPNFKPGDLVFIKASDERAFVLKVEEGTNAFFSNTLGLGEKQPFSGETALLRVPVVSEKGIHHELRRFLIEELESIPERFDRLYREEVAVRNKLSSRSQGPKLLKPEDLEEEDILDMNPEVDPKKIQ